MSSDDFTTPPVNNNVNPYSQVPVVDGQAPRTSSLAIWSLVLGLFSLLCNVFTGVIGFVLGVVALIKIGNSEGRLKGSGFAIGGIVCSLLFSVIGMGMMVGMMLPAVQQVRQAARRTESMSNMRMLALGNLNFESKYLKFPAISGDGNGNGDGLSWRVHILPQMGEQGLYQQFHLDEPWDSTHNQSLVELMPQFYMSPFAERLGPGYTVYQRPVGTGAFDDGDGSMMTFGKITDGSSNTILIVETDVSEAVPWTKPADYDFDPADPLRGLGGLHGGGFFLAAMCDGSTHVMFLGSDDGTTAIPFFTKDAGDVSDFDFSQ